MACLEVQRERKVEGNGYPPSCLDVFKISKGEGSSPYSYFNVLKIWMKMRENELNRQIYPYLKMDLQH